MDHLILTDGCLPLKLKIQALYLDKWGWIERIKNDFHLFKKTSTFDIAPSEILLNSERSVPLKHIFQGFLWSLDTLLTGYWLGQLLIVNIYWIKQVYLKPKPKKSKPRLLIFVVNTEVIIYFFKATEQYNLHFKIPLFSELNEPVVEKW